MIAQALVFELSQVPGFAGKVYPLAAPEGTAAPYIVYSTNEGIKNRSLDGLLTYRKVECLVNVTANDYPAMHNAAAAIQNRVEAFTGQTIGGDSFPVVVEECEIPDDPEEFFNEEVKKYQAMIEFTLYL